MRVLVAGAGVFGLTAAIELARRGHDVSIVDPGPIPNPFAASTDISKLIRPDYGADEFYTRFMEECLRGWHQLNKQWGEELFHPTGLLALRRDELKEGFEFESYQMLLKRGHKPVRMTSESVRKNHPAWAFDNYTDGYFHESAGWAESSRVVHRLGQDAIALGVKIIHATVTGLIVATPTGEVLSGVGSSSSESKNGEWNGITGAATPTGRIVGVTTNQSSPLHQIRGDLVVVAMGAWTTRLLPELQPLMHPTGQVVLWFKLPEKYIPMFQPPLFPPYAADIQRSGFYGFPVHPNEGHGILKIGNHGMGHVLPSLTPTAVQTKLNEVTDKEVAKFRHFLQTTFPCIADAPVCFSRICIYNDTFDSDFLIDHDPERPGLVVATGGSGHGFKFTPLLGTIIADRVERKDNPYHYRFKWRPAPKRDNWFDPTDATRCTTAGGVAPVVAATATSSLPSASTTKDKSRVTTATASATAASPTSSAAVRSAL